MKLILILSSLFVIGCAKPQAQSDQTLVKMQSQWVDVATAQVLDLREIKTGLYQPSADAIFTSGTGANQVQCRLKIGVNGDDRSGNVYVDQPTVLRIMPTTGDITPCQWLETFHGYEVIGSVLRVYVGVKSKDFVLFK